jgi:flagellar biosynthetic protein FlhB
MAHDHSDDAIHPASEIKLARARQQGEVCRSDILAQAVQTALGLGILSLAAAPLGVALVDWTREYWTQQSTLVSGQNAARTIEPIELIARLGWPLGLFLGALFLLSCASHLLQTGWSWGQRPFWSPRSLRPAANIRQWFAPNRWLAGLAGLITFGLLAGWSLSNTGDELAELSMIWKAPIDTLAVTASRQLGTWLLPIVGSLLVLGTADYCMQRWLYFHRLQMSEQELRDEQKEEQNPARTAIRKRKQG